VAGEDVVRCMLPFKIFSRKISNMMATLCMQYSKVDEISQMLCFNALSKMTKYLTTADDQSFFENSLKKMYLEFTRESKVGGGGHGVQNTLRIA